MLPGEHLDDQAPDAPYIGLLRVRDLLDDLGGHPIDRTLQRRTMQAIPWHEIVLQFFRDAKVRNLDTALVVHQDVRSLDVAMDDASLVDVVQSFQDLADEVADERLLKGTVVSQQRGDRAAWNVFQEDVEVLIVGRRVCQGRL